MHKVCRPVLVKLSGVTSVTRYVPANAAFHYGENSFSADSKSGKPFYGSRRAPACEVSEKVY
jgi:hypothetical protein